jgi:hypothetical protein
MRWEFLIFGKHVEIMLSVFSITTPNLLMTFRQLQRLNRKLVCRKFEISPSLRSVLMTFFPNSLKLRLFFSLYFWLPARLVRRGSKSTKRSRLDKNFLFSTGRIVHAIQAAPTHRPALASVSLTKGPRYNPSLENYRNFYQAADPKRPAAGSVYAMSFNYDAAHRDAGYSK